MEDAGGVLCVLSLIYILWIQWLVFGWMQQHVNMFMFTRGVMFVCLFYQYGGGRMVIIHSADYPVIFTPSRRRMEREAMAKVVASVWGAEFIKFLGALAVLSQSI